MGQQSLILIFTMWSLGGRVAELILSLDTISSIFIGLVCLISGRVMIYSVDYIDSKMVNRFIKILVGFVLSIIMLCLSPNILSSLLG